MDPATDGETWWNIDSSDSAYWAVANNINTMRAEGGLPALTVSSSLSSIAHDRCVYLIANDVFSHDGATTAEILCSGATSASAACTGWKNSSGHYANIMTPGYTQMGIACTFNTAYCLFRDCLQKANERAVKGSWNTTAQLVKRGYAAKAPLLPVRFAFILCAGTTDAPSPPAPPLDKITRVW